MPPSLLTFHERRVGAAVVVKVSAVRVVQAVISQAVSVAETLEDAVHEALQEQTQHSSISGSRRGCATSGVGPSACCLATSQVTQE